VKFDSKQQECKRIRINESIIQSIDTKACGGRVNANAVVMMYQYTVHSDTRTLWVISNIHFTVLFKSNSVELKPSKVTTF